MAEPLHAQQFSVRHLYRNCPPLSRSLRQASSASRLQTDFHPSHVLRCQNTKQGQSPWLNIECASVIGTIGIKRCLLPLPTCLSCGLTSLCCLPRYSLGNGCRCGHYPESELAPSRLLPRDCGCSESARSSHCNAPSFACLLSASQARIHDFTLLSPAATTMRLK